MQMYPVVRMTIEISVMSVIIIISEPSTLICTYRFMSRIFLLRCVSSSKHLMAPKLLSFKLDPLAIEGLCLMKWLLFRNLLL